MGLNLLDCLEDLVAANFRNYLQYEEELVGSPGIELLRYGTEERSNYQYIVLKVNEEKAGISRDQLVSTLWAENVLTRRYFYPGCHRMEPYASDGPDQRLSLPVTEDIVERVVVLPCGASLGPVEIGGICQIVRFVLENGPAVRENLERNGWSGFEPGGK
jgi:dTDP-4-amino-4,6-dideoxygalactose transaminase